MDKLKKYIKAVYKSWIIIFVTTVGFVGSLIAFIPEVSLNKSYSKLLALLLCIVLSIIVTLIAKPIGDVIENLTVDDLVFEINTSSKILFPYEEKYLKPINVIANSYYANVNPDLSILKSWYRKNPFVLITLADNHSSIIGYYDILPLTDSFANDFINGKVSETDINSDCILSPKQMKKANYLYFAGVAIKDYTKQRNRIYSGQLVYSAFIYLTHFYNLDKEITMFAIASTSCGEKLLKKLGYVLESSRHNRKDETDLYLKKINKEIIEKDRDELALITNKIDYSNLIKTYNLSKKTHAI